MMRAARELARRAANSPALASAVLAAGIAGPTMAHAQGGEAAATPRQAPAVPAQTGQMAASTPLPGAQQLQGQQPGTQEQGQAVVYELMVKMTCESCARAVRAALGGLPETEVVRLDVGTEEVVVKSSLAVESLLQCLEQAGRTARLVGMGSDHVSDISSSLPAGLGSLEENTACVAEFKGELYGHGSVKGVVRIVQVSASEARAQANLTGLEPGAAHSLAVHMFGDSRPGCAGPVFDGAASTSERPATERSGFLWRGTADEAGNLRADVPKVPLKVWELIGRGLAVHEGDAADRRLAGSVLARSAGVGANHKKLCTCDGTVIWEATD